MTQPPFHVLILGAGGMGRAIAYDLRRNDSPVELTVLDRNVRVLEELQVFFGRDGVRVVNGNLEDRNLLTDLLREADMAVGAATYRLNFDLTRLAVENGASWIDLGGNNDVVNQQFILHDRAISAGVTVIPDCGLAPGLVNVIASDMADRFDNHCRRVQKPDGNASLREIHLRVGGLPQFPKPPLFYGPVFSPEGLINEYVEPAKVIENGEIMEVPSLTGWERIYVGPPLGTLEAFHTSGGLSTLIDSFSGRVQTLDYKTLRFAGHLRRVKLLADLGYFSDSALVASSSESYVPRKVTETLLSSLGWEREDMVVLKAWAVGQINSGEARIDYRLIDYADSSANLTAMARTTAFPAAVTARMILDGRIDRAGVLRQEEAVDSVEFFRELETRGITIEITESG